MNMILMLLFVVVVCVVAYNAKGEDYFLTTTNSNFSLGLSYEDKIEQEKRDAEDIRKGIVKFRVDMYDQTGESVAVATILTMVKFRDQQV